MLGKAWSQIFLVFFRMKAPCAGHAPLQSMAAGARVGSLDVALHGQPLCQPGGLDVLPRTGARVGPAVALQVCQGRLVVRMALGLPPHRIVRVQTAACKLAQNKFSRTGRAARCVHVFDACQPAPTPLITGAGVKPACQSGNQRARMQWARG